MSRTRETSQEDARITYMRDGERCRGNGGGDEISMEGNLENLKGTDSQLKEQSEMKWSGGEGEEVSYGLF